MIMLSIMLFGVIALALCVLETFAQKDNHKKRDESNHVMVCMSRQHKQSDCWIPECAFNGHMRRVKAERWKAEMLDEFRGWDFCYVEVRMS